MKNVFLAATIAALATAATSQSYDVNGNPIGHSAPRVDGPAGQVLSTIAAPVQLIGTAEVNGDIAGVTISTPSAIYTFTPSGTPVSTLSHGFNGPYGLGFDTRRREYVMTAAGPGTIGRVDLTGAVTTVFPAPSTRPIGCAYDVSRDAYWVSDWSANLLHLIDASTGVTIQPSFSLSPSGCTRSADVGYSVVNDMIAINGRNTNRMYLFRAGNPPTLVGSFQASSSSPTHGAAIPLREQTIWSGVYQGTRIEQIDSGLPRVVSAPTVSVGTSLAIQWTAGGSAGEPYLAAASFGETGVPIGNRFILLTIDSLFTLSINQPAIFAGMAGTLDGSGNANGAVNVPNIAQLSGIPFSLAFITLDVSAPQQVEAISGPKKVLIVP